RLAAMRPESLLFWYRTSPRPLIPLSNRSPVGAQNPPLNVGGMTLVIVDASGRLLQFLAVPQPADADNPQGPRDCNTVFEAAGLSMAAFTPAAPGLLPPVYADERLAWEGKLPELVDQPVRVEVGAVRGRPVFFTITGPWTRSARAAPLATPRFNVITANMEAMLIPSLMVVGATLARRNVRLGRGDRRGAFRAGAAVFAMSMLAWLLSPHVMPLDVDVQRMFSNIGVALFDAATMWLTYLGLEPYVRKHAPDSMIGWTRLIAGRWRDPRVGADMMVGVSAGLAMT